MRVLRRRNTVMYAMLVMGCSTEAPTPAISRAASETLGNLRASPPVAILAVGGTQQLSATGVSLTGTPLTSFDSVQYVFNSLADTVRVKLTSAGLATALAPSSAAVLVNAFAYQGDVARGDQVLLQVTATVVPGATLSIQPIVPDSAKQAIGTAKTIIPVIKNPTTNVSVANPVMKYTVKPADATHVGVYMPTLRLTNSTIVQLAPSPTATASQILPQVPTGSAWIYATANVYGMLLQDSVLYTFTYPYTITVATGKNQLEVSNAFAYQTLTLAPGATITFSNTVAATDPLTIAYTFDNPTAATAASPASTTGGATGNVTALIGQQTSKRVFLTPGTYHWTVIAASGPAPWNGQSLTGTIVIK